MDDCVIVADVWSLIIAFAPIESAAVASQLCRYTRNLVTRHCPTLTSVPQDWRDFTVHLNTTSIHLYKEAERYQREARFFVRELVRLRIHQHRGLTTYTRLTTTITADRITSIALSDHYFVRTNPFGERRQIRAYEVGICIDITYDLNGHWSSGMLLMPGTFNAVLAEKRGLAPSLDDLLLQPLTAKAWGHAGRRMCKMNKKFPDDIALRYVRYDK